MKTYLNTLIDMQDGIFLHLHTQRVSADFLSGLINMVRQVELLNSSLSVN